MVPCQRTWTTLLGFLSFYKSLTESYTSQAIFVSWCSFPCLSFPVYLRVTSSQSPTGKLLQVFFSLSSLQSSEDYYFHIKAEVPLLTWDVMPFQSTITVMDILCSTTFQGSWESRFCCFLLQKFELEYSKGSSSHTSLELLCRMEYVEKKYFFFLHLPWIWKPYF